MVAHLTLILGRFAPIAFRRGDFIMIVKADDNLVDDMVPRPER